MESCGFPKPKLLNKTQTKKNLEVFLQVGN